MPRGYNVNKESGYAPRQSWMRLNDTDVTEVTGQENPSNNTECIDRRYAQLTYQVNATPVEITGGISANITAVGLNDSGQVQLSGDQLKTFDQGVINKLNDIQILSESYSTLIREHGNYTYIMKASVGSGTSGEPIWQIKRINEVGNKTDIEWADGNKNFDNIASGYLSLTYSI